MDSKELEVSEIKYDEMDELKLYFEDLYNVARVGPKGYFIIHKDINALKDQLSSIHNMQFRQSDIIVNSFPRSGTTMAQELVWLIANNLDYDTAASKYQVERYIPLMSLFGSALKKIASLEEIQQEQMKRKITVPSMATTDRRFVKTHLPLSLLPPATVDTAKVVYIARNPLDVAVSLYHLKRSLANVKYVGDLKMFWDFFVRDSVIWTPYFSHVKEAWGKRHHSNMLFLFYEDMTMDLPNTIQRICTFLNKSYSAEQIENLCEHMKFVNFQKNKSVNLEFMKNHDVFVTNEENFIRKGVIGGWRDYFDKDLIKKAIGWIEDNLRHTDLRFPGLDDQLKTNL